MSVKNIKVGDEKVNKRNFYENKNYLRWNT